MQNKEMEKKGINLKPSQKWMIILAVAAATATGIFSFYSLASTQFSQKNSSETTLDSNPTIKTITSLGRIVPQGKVTRLSATVPDEGKRVKQLLVKEGDLVQKGQVIALLDSHQRRLATLKQTQEEVKLAKARLEQVKAGAKAGAIKAQSGTIERLKAELQGQIVAQEAQIASLQARLKAEKQAQEATIERFQAQLKNAQTECKRYEKLYQDGAISVSEYDSRCLQEKTLQEQLNEAEANLNRIVTTLSEEIKEAQATLTRTVVTLQKQIIEAEATLEEISEVRPVDVQVAQAEVDKAIAIVKQAEANLELAYVRAPIDGRILELHIRPGENITQRGILEIGKTDQMEIIAEVYKTDIGQVGLGQEAIITSEAFPNQLTGKVSQIGLQVKQQNIFSNQPGSDVDRKVVEVKIQLDPESSQQVSQLTNLQVEVAIQL